LSPGPKSNIAALRTPDISSARQLTIVIAATWDGLTLSVGPERGVSDVRSDACAELSFEDAKSRQLANSL
jgi:hypothetical protein